MNTLKSIIGAQGVERIMGGEILDYPVKRILNKRKAEGRAEGWDSASLVMIKNLMAAMNLDIVVAMAALKIPDDKRS